VAKHGGNEPEVLHYDYFVAATGLRLVWPVVPQSLRRKQYLFEAGDHIRDVAAGEHGVVVVGGGAVGIEMAAELKLVQLHVKVTLAHSRAKLLSSEPLPDECKDRALDLTREAGVEVLLEHRLDSTSEMEAGPGKRPVQELTFANGHKMLADKVVMAVSRSVPSGDFLPRSALDDEGLVKIKPRYVQLQPLSSPYVEGIHTDRRGSPDSKPLIPFRGPQRHTALLRGRPGVVVGHQALRGGHAHGLLRGAQHAPADAVGAGQ